MRIGQAIDNVYRNNNLEYESERLRVRYNTIACEVEVINKGKGYICNNLLMSFINENFKLIQKPVSFMEAVASGKDFRVEHEDCKLHPSLKYMEVEDFIYHLYDNCDGRNFKDIILEGNFYIKEDN